MASLLRRSVVPLVVAALSLTVLAGCVPDSPDPVETGGGPNPSGDPTGQPVPTLTAAPVGTPIDAACSDLVSADTIYAFNPNFGLIDPFPPADGSAAASAVSYQGVACRWQNQ